MGYIHEDGERTPDEVMAELKSRLLNVLPYPCCSCGHRFDGHRGSGDPRGEGCWLCKCASYDPLDAVLNAEYISDE